MGPPVEPGRKESNSNAHFVRGQAILVCCRLPAKRGRYLFGPALLAQADRLRSASRHPIMRAHTRQDQETLQSVSMSAVRRPGGQACDVRQARQEEARVGDRSEWRSEQSGQDRVAAREVGEGATGERMRGVVTWRLQCGSPSAWSARSSSPCPFGRRVYHESTAVYSSTGRP